MNVNHYLFIIFHFVPVSRVQREGHMRIHHHHLLLKSPSMSLKVGIFPVCLKNLHLQNASHGQATKYDPQLFGVFLV